MQTTTNFGLKKPEATDPINVDDLNYNADIIDAVLGQSGGSSVFAGKTASFYGDSLTEVNSHYTKGYHAWIKEILGLSSYNNYGFSGRKTSDVYAIVNSRTDTADIIFVMCGVNDQTFSVPIGEFGDTTTDTTYGAFYCLCNLLKTKYPQKTIIFITPHYQSKFPHSAGITSLEVGEAMKRTCDKFSIPCYDNRVMSGIYFTNLSVYTTDNCHWNNKGHELVGKNVAQWVIDNVRYLYNASTVPVTGVTLDKTNQTVTQGNNFTLIATVSPSNATNKNVTWSTNNANVSIVSSGLSCAVTGANTGNSIITCTTQDGNYTASCSVQIEAGSVIPVTGITLNKTSSELTTGGTETLVATVSPNNATNKNVVWSSSDNSKATVNNGVITAISAGNVVITATTEDGGFTAQCSYSISAQIIHVSSVSLNKTTATIYTGGTETLIATVSPTNATNKNVTWASSNTSVATVNNGVVTAVSEGNTTITATTEDGGLTASCSLAVEQYTVVGKTVTVSKNFIGADFAHIGIVIPVDGDVVNGANVSVRMTGTQATNMLESKSSGIPIYSSQHGEVADSDYIAEVSPRSSSVQSVAAGMVELTYTTTLSREIITPYIKIALIVAGNVTHSFVVESLQIEINGVSKNPKIVGDFFPSTKEILTIT